MWRDLKYLIAYLAPATAFAAVAWQGAWSWATFILAFVLIPLGEQLLGGSSANLSAEEEREKVASLFFDWLLYLNVPILYALVWYYLDTVVASRLTPFEMVGMTVSTGIVVGTIGINVAHELGHRHRRHERLMAKVLLMVPLYTHFFIEHNRGHHRRVATPEDPASAPPGQSVYAFWVRSITGSYLHAWQLERQRLAARGLPWWHPSNEMLQLQALNVLYVLAVYTLFGIEGLGFAVAIALIGVLLLETVNYIEHYGLRRRRLSNGHYERVQPWHSWNSDHELGRIFLYELTRHSDHHYKASRKYQILRHFDESPQLKYGYPASMLLALVPPLWFRLMDERLHAWKSKRLEALG